MRLVSYRPAGESAYRSGIQTSSGVVDAAEAAGVAGVDLASAVSTRDLLALDGAVLAELQAASTGSNGASMSLDDIELGPPIVDPPKIICLGLNYRDHAEEAGLTPPSTPMFFAKWANSLIGPGGTIVPPATTEKVDYEAELAVVIGTPGRHIAAADAMTHVAGAMVLNDVSARDLQMANNLWTGGKAIDTFAPCGPALVTLDEIEDVQALGIRTRVNGAVLQDGNTGSMVFGVAEIIAFLSQIMTLETGDIIATGTPAGVGASRTPPIFLKDGDVVETEIDGIGTLRNPVAAAVGS